MWWNTQRSNDIFKELFHWENVQVEPITGDGILSAYIFSRYSISMSVTRCTYVQVLQICGDGWAQALTVAPTKENEWRLNSILLWFAMELIHEHPSFSLRFKSFRVTKIYVPKNRPCQCQRQLTLDHISYNQTHLALVPFDSCIPERISLGVLFCFIN